ncbi:unnamed protein product [Withania somnifera]
MIPTYTNSSSPSFPLELNNSEVHLHHHDHLTLSSDHHHNNIIIPHVNPYNNYQFASSSSNSSSCQTFFNTNIQDQRDNYTYHSQFHQPQHQHEVDNFGSRSISHDHIEKKNKGLKLTLWRKEEQKMKNNLKLDDQKQQQTESTDHSSHNSSSNNNNIPIRVCSDCNTTKTPLWRSGPKGPKSLCNACGIRQRKARRAMAAAAAANGTNFSSTTGTSTTTTMKIKVQQQKQKITKVNTNHVVPFKKRCKFLSNNTTPAPSPAPSPAPASAPVRHIGSSSSSLSSQKMKKLSFDDFFVDLSNNLGIHRVFPQDEKEAAILLMALSSGLVHG